MSLFGGGGVWAKTVEKPRNKIIARKDFNIAFIVLGF